MKRIPLLDPSTPVRTEPSRSLGALSLAAIVGAATTTGTGCFVTGTVPIHQHDSGPAVFDADIQAPDAGQDAGPHVFDGGIYVADAGQDAGPQVFDAGIYVADAGIAITPSDGQ